MLPATPERLPLAQLPTPLEPLDEFSRLLGGPRIWLKRDDLTGNLLTGNKVRKLEFIAADALSKGADLLLTCGGLQSNHCRATAFVAARLRMKCHLILRGRRPDTFDGNLLLDRLAGASISYHSPSEWQHLDRLFDAVVEDYLHQGFSPYTIPTGASNGVGLWGYISAAQELLQDFERCGFAPELVAVATGSGGTHLGLALGFAAMAPVVKVRGYAVCDSRGYFERKALDDLKHWQETYRIASTPAVTIDVVDRYIGQGYGLPQPEVLHIIEQLARTEGVLLDPVYTGKAFYGLVEQIRSGELAKLDNIVFVHTGGVFGVFPYRDSFYPSLA